MAIVYRLALTWERRVLTPGVCIGCLRPFISTAPRGAKPVVGRIICPMILGRLLPRPVLGLKQVVGQSELDGGSQGAGGLCSEREYSSCLLSDLPWLLKLFLAGSPRLQLVFRYLRYPTGS